MLIICKDVHTYHVYLSHRLIHKSVNETMSSKILCYDVIYCLSTFTGICSYLSWKYNGNGETE